MNKHFPMYLDFLAARTLELRKKLFSVVPHLTVSSRIVSRSQGNTLSAWNINTMASALFSALMVPILYWNAGIFSLRWCLGRRSLNILIGKFQQVFSAWNFRISLTKLLSKDSSTVEYTRMAFYSILASSFHKSYQPLPRVFMGKPLSTFYLKSVYGKLRVLF